VAIPDLFGGTALGSILTSVEAFFIVKMNIGHPVSKSKFRTLVKVNLGRLTSR
jgi:hypothetical protein